MPLLLHYRKVHPPLRRMLDHFVLHCDEKRLKDLP